ncbi:hypothetical protein Psuf_054710 [Phytohabitans suffuscus]|uniref:Uncharacterized protein n=1 Tax=Phytohabitans suffuscus TaxID=624315 RepID=A0A6F8YQH1_9ACTN|nr:hypothetical protein Psuf_054710 [Phytohabitans suffuscus]
MTTSLLLSFMPYTIRRARLASQTALRLAPAGPPRTRRTTGRTSDLLARTRVGRGSGYEKAEAELRRVEGDDVAVAFGPPA